MGQAMTTLFRHWLGRVVVDEETAGTACSFFDLYWKMAKAILRLLKQLLVGRAGKPPPTGPGHLCIDIGKNREKVVLESPSIISSREVEIGSVDEAEAEAGCHGGGVDNLSPAPEQPIKLGPYSAEQRILLVGEGDFSFSSSLALSLGDASNMIATSLDSFEYLKENYKRAEKNIRALTSRGCIVMHGVDATTMAINLYPQLCSLKFNYILFNFPYALFSHPKPPRDAQISGHQELARGFLANAKQMIQGDGQIHITHQCFGYYLEWNLQMLASSEGLVLVEESPFNSQDHPGYCAKFGCGGDGSFNCNPSKTYKFQLPSPLKKKKTRRKKNKLQVVS